MPHVITAEFSLNTPLFSSGADSARPELRTTEIKAALRFWWRAMNYGLVSAPGGSIQKLAEREAQLFGSTKGQSPFLLRVIENKIDVGSPILATTLVPNMAARYLGYGLTEIDNTRPIPRAGRQAGSDKTFILALTIKGQAIDNGYEPEYIAALKLFGLFGGLGYRSRRGFGSLTLRTLSINGTDAPLTSAPQSYQNLFQNKDLLGKCPAAIFSPAQRMPPEYSAFVQRSEFCRVVLLNMLGGPFDTGMKALDAVADKFKKLLTSPIRGESRQQKNRDVTTDDVSWAYLGLPRKYGPGSIEHSPSLLDKKSKQVELERRASPLLLHVYRNNANDYRAVAILFKSRFLPDSYGVAAGKSVAKNLPLPHSSGYEWIDTWLTSIGTDITYPAVAA
jgi:CRISPR-associated protein Cmr1